MNTNAAQASVLPWDTSVGNRFAHYSPRNHSATVWIATALALTYVVGVLIIRVHIKRKVFGWDDSLIFISTVRFLRMTVCNTTDSLRYLCSYKALLFSMRSATVLGKFQKTLKTFSWLARRVRVE